MKNILLIIFFLVSVNVKMSQISDESSIAAAIATGCSLYCQHGYSRGRCICAVIYLQKFEAVTKIIHILA